MNLVFWYKAPSQQGNANPQFYNDPIYIPVDLSNPSSEVSVFFYLFPPFVACDLPFFLVQARCQIRKVVIRCPFTPHSSVSLSDSLNMIG